MKAQKSRREGLKPRPAWFSIGSCGAMCSGLPPVSLDDPAGIGALDAEDPSSFVGTFPFAPPS